MLELLLSKMLQKEKKRKELTFKSFETQFDKTYDGLKYLIFVN